MNKRNLNFFAPIGVAFGITVLLYLSILISKVLNILQISELLSFVPTCLIVVLGAILLGIFLPVFIFGIIYLNRRGAIRQSKTLKKMGYINIVEIQCIQE